MYIIELRVEEPNKVSEVPRLIPQLGYMYARTIIETGRKSVSGSLGAGMIVDELILPYFT